MRVGDRKRLSDQLAAARRRIGELEEELTRLSQRDPLIPTLLSLSAFRTQLDLDVARAHRYERPLTVALLDRVADALRHRLGADATSMPLAKILEGGTWAAGRLLARERRADASPPVKVISDGTVF